MFLYICFLTAKIQNIPCGDSYLTNKKCHSSQRTTGMTFSVINDCSLYYSARKVKRLKSTTASSGSTAFNISATVFFGSMMLSCFNRQTSFKNLPRRPLAMFSIMACGRLAAFSAATVALISLARFLQCGVNSLLHLFSLCLLDSHIDFLLLH